MQEMSANFQWFCDANTIDARVVRIFTRKAEHCHTLVFRQSHYSIYTDAVCACDVHIINERAANFLLCSTLGIGFHYHVGGRMARPTNSK